MSFKVTVVSGGTAGTSALATGLASSFDHDGFVVQRQAQDAALLVDVLDLDRQRCGGGGKRQRRANNAARRIRDKSHSPRWPQANLGSSFLQASIRPCTASADFVQRGLFLLRQLQLDDALDALVADHRRHADIKILDAVGPLT